MKYHFEYLKNNFFNKNKNLKYLIKTTIKIRHQKKKKINNKDKVETIK